MKINVLLTLRNYHCMTMVSTFFRISAFLRLRVCPNSRKKNDASRNIYLIRYKRVIGMQCHCLAPDCWHCWNKPHVHRTQLDPVLWPCLAFGESEEQSKNHDDEHSRENEPARESAFAHHTAAVNKGICVKNYAAIKCDIKTHIYHSKPGIKLSRRSYEHTHGCKRMSRK